MSCGLSVDSGVESEFDFDDFEEESKGTGAGGSSARKRAATLRKPPSVLKTMMKDPSKPPLVG